MPDDRSAGFVKGWYRRSFELDKNAVGKRIILHFDVIGYEALLFVNGKEAGSHHGDFTPWDIDVTDLVKFDAPNSLAIRVYSDFGPTFGGARKAKHTYGSQWSIDNIKGGIWQDASIVYESPIIIKRALINPDLANSSIKVDYVIENTGKAAAEYSLGALVVQALKKSSNQSIGALQNKIKLNPGTNSGSFEIKLDKPEYWSPENPYLYYLALALTDKSGKVAGFNVERFGFRDFKVKDRNFYLNGKKIYLYGENLPSVRYGGYGKNPDEEYADAAEKIQGFKSLGYNIIRNPHMPILPRIIDIMDECGLMLYDEWAWSFTASLDETCFEAINLKEMTEWVYNDYNHASVVAWSCGNEVVHKNSAYVHEQLDKQVQKLRELDKSGRPVGSFSGSASFGQYGKGKLDTDFLDLHTYLGLSAPAWTFWDKAAARNYGDAVEIYGKNGKLEMPYIIWECVGFSWGARSDASFKLNDISLYEKYVNMKTNWGQPNGIGFAGCIGLAATLDPNRGMEKVGQNTYGKRILEYVRQDNIDVQGYAPWFHGSKLDVATTWNQPVFCGLRGEGEVPLRNVFAGKKYKQTFFIVNSTDSVLKDAEVTVAVTCGDGKMEVVSKFKADSVKSFEKISKEIEFSIPASPAAPRKATVIVSMKAGGKEISRNFYDIFIQDSAILTKPLENVTGKIGILEPHSPDGAKAVAAILDSIGVKYSMLSSADGLDKFTCLIIPPAEKPSDFFSESVNPKIVSWTSNGGVLVQFEQRYPGNFRGQSLKKLVNTFVDVPMLGHPVFAGLDQTNFDTWNNPEDGLVITYAGSPFNQTALAVRGPHLGQQGINNAVSDAAFKSGRIFSSQLNAVSLWGVDSAASTYLVNVIKYAVCNGGKPYKDIKPFTAQVPAMIDVDPAKIKFVDLRPYATRGFSDDKDGDKLGGWTDQGDNDFRKMPLGKQTFCGVPFDIIDPATNNGKSCIPLKCGGRDYFPEAVNGIKVDENFSRIFFLHTSAWGNTNQPACEYTINYVNGSKAKIVVKDWEGIADWWSCADLKAAKLAVTVPNKTDRDVAAYLYTWENPNPELKIASIDFRSFGFSLPILIAVSGEKPSDASLVIDDMKDESTKWAKMSHPGKDNVPDVSFVKGATAEDNALKVSMNAQKEDSTPIVFKRFSTDSLKTQDYKYLTFMIKGETNGSLDIVLPEKDWKDSLFASIPVSAADGWKKVRLSLKEDMGLKTKKWTLKDLRGEFFIYNGMSNDKKASPRGAVSFQIKNIRFE